MLYKSKVVSKTAPTASQDMTMESNLTLECHNTLNNLPLHKERVIELFWIPEQNGIMVNAIADNIAETGRSASTFGLQISCGNILNTNLEIYPTV